MCVLLPIIGANEEIASSLPQLTGLAVQAFHPSEEHRLEKNQRGEVQKRVAGKQSRLLMQRWAREVEILGP